MNKQKAEYTCSGTLLSLKTERNCDTCNNMEEPWRHYTKWIYIRYHLRKVPREVNSNRWEIGWWWPGAGTIGGRVILRCWKSSGEGWWRWLHSDMNVLNATELHTLKRLKTQISHYVYFTATFLSVSVFMPLPYPERYSEAGAQDTQGWAHHQSWSAAFWKTFPYSSLQLAAPLRPRRQRPPTWPSPHLHPSV